MVPTKLLPGWPPWAIIPVIPVPRTSARVVLGMMSPTRAILQCTLQAARSFETWAAMEVPQLLKRAEGSLVLQALAVKVVRTLPTPAALLPSTVLRTLTWHH
jgi:hypothetical protein